MRVLQDIFQSVGGGPSSSASKRLARLTFTCVLLTHSYYSGNSQVHQAVNSTHFSPTECLHVFDATQLVHGGVKDVVNKASTDAKYTGYPKRETPPQMDISLSFLS